jgi:hypothetical protein
MWDFGCICGAVIFVGPSKNSAVLQVLTTFPLVCGLIVFVPLVLLSLMWIWYGLYGDKGTVTNETKSQPPAITNYIRWNYLRSL